MTRHDAERKRKIMDVIAATIRARGYPPSVREIAMAVGLASTSAVHHHLQVLEKEGYLERGAAQSRAIRLTPTAALRLGLSASSCPSRCASESHRPAGDRRDRRRRTDRGLPGRVGDARRPGHPRARRRRLRAPRPGRLDDRGAHRGRGLRRHPPAGHRPQWRHRRRPGRGERGHPQAVLPREGPRPPPARQPELPAAVLSRRADPGKLIGVIRRLD